jgi:hypothetical protein
MAGEVRRGLAIQAENDSLKLKVGSKRLLAYKLNSWLNILWSSEMAGKECRVGWKC